MQVGICIPESITVYTSDNGTDYTEVGKYETGVSVQAKYDAWYNNGTNDASQIKIERIKTQLNQIVSARYVKIVVKNPMQSYTGGAYHNGGAPIAKTWIGMDEIELGITSYTREQLKALIDTAKATDTSGKQVDSVLALDTALTDAESFYNSGSTTAVKLKNVYTALETALQGLKDAKTITVNSSTANTNSGTWPSINSALDGDYANEAARWIILTSATDTPVEGINVILDMGESTSIMAVGYSAQSRPNSGIYMQNATYYVSDSPDGGWQQVGYISGTAHKGSDPATAENQTLTAAANGGKGRYVKVVFSNCRDYELTVDGSLKKSEWLYLSEILINKFCPITLTTQKATVDMTDSDGNTVGALGAIYGKDVTFSITPNKNAVLETATVNGNAVSVQDNSFTIPNVTSAQNVVISYVGFADEEMPTITGMKDLYVAKDNALTFDPRIDLVAKDMNGVDITADVTYTSTIAASVGTYTVTYSVTAPNGATTTATTNVHVLDSLNSKHVVAATPSIDDVDSHNKMDKAQILVDDLYAPEGAPHSNPSFMSWKNTDNIEIIVALDGTQEITDIGYSLGSMPSVGAYPPDVKFYTASEIGIGKATTWTYAGKIEAELHEGEFTTTQLVKKMLTIPAMTTGYIKAVICFDDSAEMLGNYSETPNKGDPEWTFVDEIITGVEYELDSSIKIAGMNVKYETDGTMSINIHCPNPQATEKLVVKNVDGTVSKYGTIVANSETFVDSYYAGTVAEIPAGSKMYVLKNLSASDLYKEFVVTRVVNNTTVSEPQNVSLQSYFTDVINGNNTIYPEGTSDDQKASDKKLAASAMYYGSTSDIALNTGYDPDAKPKTKILYWDGTTTAPADSNGDGIYEIDAASDIAYLAQAVNGYQTYGNTYKVNSDIAAFVMQLEDNSAIKDKTSAAAVQAFFASAENLKEWKTIGYEGKYPFQGTFDGNGATIYGMYSNWPEYLNDASSGNDYLKDNYGGLFGLVDQGATIKNITVANSHFITKGGMMGAIAGKAAQTNVKWNATDNSGLGTVTIENCTVKNNYMRSNGSDSNVGVVIGSFYDGDNFDINNIIVYGNDAYNNSTSNAFGFNGEPNNSDTNSLKNAIILGCAPYYIVAAQRGASMPKVFSNVYTDTVTPDPYAIKDNKATWADYEGKIIEIAASDVMGANAKATCKTLDWNDTWFVGLGDDYPQFSKTVYKMPSDIQALYDTFTVNATDNYGDGVKDTFGVYATSVNLKANPYIAFTFAFNGQYKQNRDNIKVIFTTASGKVIETTVGDGNGGVSAGWTNNEGAGRYHLYRLTDISVLDLKGEITVKVVYNGNENNFGVFSLAGFATAMQAAYEQVPCTYYSTRVEALKALLFYIETLDERYNVAEEDDGEYDEDEDNPGANVDDEDDFTGGRI